MHAALFPYVWRYGEQCLELTVVLANPAPIEASWCVMCSYRSGFEGGGVAVG
jgi:hypothetical protein